MKYPEEMAILELIKGLETTFSMHTQANRNVQSGVQQDTKFSCTIR